MAATIDAPQQWVENIAMLRLPEQADRRLQQLMDRNNEGQLTEQEKADLSALAKLSEQLSLVRADSRVFIVARAGSRCEYCKMHQSLQGGGSTFRRGCLLKSSNEFAA
jgi:hypothetical protein